jgi:type IV pilus assembly protein PilE
MTSLRRTKRSFAGFTLIEVMITVAVVAILAAVALPNYFDYVTRSRIVEAKTNLADMRTRFEQYFLDNRSYPAACVAGPTAPPNIALPGSQKYFNVTCGDLTATTYTVTARGVGNMSAFVYTVKETNERKTTGLPAGWSGLNSLCWVSKKNGDC